MTIKINSFSDSPPSIQIDVYGKEDVATFRTLIQRGINTWADAPADMKIACDRILYGNPLQDYHTLSGNKI